MKRASQYRLAFLVAAAMGMTACGGEDGKDGLPGEPGEPGAPWVPPVVTTSAIAKVITWQYTDGVVNVEFSLVNQDEIPVEDLDKVQLMSTIKNEAGLLADTVDVTWIADDENAPGTLTHLGEGIYNLSMPHENATPESIGTGYIRPGNGANGMPRTKRVMFTKNDHYAQVSTTDDAKCVACHGEFEDATGNATWGWHQHHHALDNDQEVVIVEACLVCHTQTEKEDGGWANNTMAMLGHGLKYIDGVKQASGHAALGSNYSMDKYRCSTCHIDDVVFTASLNGCATCHDDLQDPDKDLAVNHSNFNDLDCASCHNSFQHDHENGTNRDEALNRYKFEVVTVARSEDKATIEVTAKATDSEGKVVDILAIEATDAQPSGWATVMKNGEAMLPGRDAGHVARSISTRAGDDNTTVYIIEHALPYEEGEVLFGGVDGSVHYTHRWGYPAKAPISVSNVKDVRRTSSDGLKCLSCHTEGLDGHGSKRGGFDLGGDSCVQCHSAYNWEHAKQGEDYPMAWGPFVHNMHFGAYKEGRDLSDMPTTDRNMPVDCQACHTGLIDLDDVAPAVVLNGMDEAGVYGITAITANCSTCHTGDSAKNHMIQQGGEFNVPVVPVGSHTGEGADYAIFDPAPITESCSVCHTPARLAESHKF